MSDERDFVNVDKESGLWEVPEGAPAPEWPTAWATIKIDMRLMTPEQREAIWQAGSLLHDAGLHFDTGFGEGCRDWEFDWSLSGARLVAKPIYCMGSHEQWRFTDFERILWTVYRSPSGGTPAYAYCSEECQETAERGHKESGWEVILRDSSQRVHF